MKQTKSIRMQVLLEPKLYNEITNIMQEKKLVFSSESAMIRYVIDRYIVLDGASKIQIENLQRALDQSRDNNTKNEELIDNLRTQLNEERKSYDIQIHNLKVKLKNEKRDRKRRVKK